jgi:hemerythrin-like metal-binding protein
MALVWSDEKYATGFEDVDAQHRQMFGMANELLAALEHGESREKIVARLDTLGDHAVRHFECEEGHMERLQCPVRVTNECAHEWFLQDFAALRELFDEQGNTPHFIEEVEEKVCGWLRKHLMAIDLVLRRFSS